MAELPTRRHLYLFGVAVLVEAANRIGSPRVVDRMARALGALAHRWSRDKRTRTERAITHVFGPLSDAERTRIVRGTFHTFWDDTLSFVPWRAAAPPAPEIVGAEHLQTALAAGRGVILWESGFFGRRNIAKQALWRQGFALHQVHAETHRAGFVGDSRASWLRDRVVLPYFTAREREFTADVVLLAPGRSLATVRTLQALLRRNQIVCITADVAIGERLVTLPILGQPKRFATGMVSLARASGAVLLPLFCVAASDGRIRVVVEPPIAVPAGGERDAATEAPLRDYAALLGTYIRRYPEQYRSWHFPWWEAAA